jgi:hypothetical protein
MELNFEPVTGSPKYVPALIAAFKRFFHRTSQQNGAKSISVPPIAEHSTLLHGQDIYREQSDCDPPTPHWGC